MMDPKMDSGYLGPGENHAQALEDDYDIMRELAPEEVVGIMDKLLCHEVGSVVSAIGALLMLYRWHGIWDTHFLKRSSHPYTLTHCYGPYPRQSKTPGLIVTTNPISRMSRHWCIWSSGRTALRWSRLATLFTLEWFQSSTMRLVQS